MPAANFKGRFAPAVLRGTKRTTIRPGARFKIGQRFFGYFGMRTKECLLLAEGVVCQVDAISIGADAVTVAGVALSARALLALAKGDGFANIAEFRAFFITTYGELPFEGQLIQWEPEVLPAALLRLRRDKLREAMGENLASGLKDASPKMTAGRASKCSMGRHLFSNVRADGLRECLWCRAMTKETA
jgi:hypothetical protein